ncbi:MAG: hypothetical protein HFH31_04295 [Bacilli bacterium]|nr:hypothetical protein [Bacilli bacterium]
MTKRKARTVRFTKGESMVYMGAAIAFVLTFIFQVFFSAQIGNMKMDIQEMRYEIKEQEKKNESLSMKVSELTAFDKVKDVVKDMGLAYNNDNIIIVNE